MSHIASAIVFCACLAAGMYLHFAGHEIPWYLFVVAALSAFGAIND